MKDFIKKHRKLLIGAAASVLVASVAVTGFVLTRPIPQGPTGQAAAVANAAAADDWAALPVDAAGKPIGEPEIPRDANGDAIIPAGQADEKRSADEPLPVAEVKAGTMVLDTTAVTAPLLGLLTATKNTNATLNPDACLLDWAKTTLPTVVGTAFSGVKNVCGREAAVMYGGYSTSVHDLNLHAQYAPDEAERAALRKVLFETDHLGYASVATDDGHAVLMVAAASDATSAATGTGSADAITRTEPVVTGTPPPAPN
ncbi:hypothetical protein [Cryobacterium zhongshanensis]|uniref:Uncharacterized protein n=1 Tax=Cryobacterium zhongshanensis TaxID=2928153 RepID=A0AA41UH47_9MICO|nr:hypothetical protein [Cryobacterium zhongshanensis]MCI4659540.1 hypothetical protein [Cryobacterium zhongshanensis]